MKKFEHSEVSTGNASGKAGVSSLPFNKGYYSSKNNNDFGIDFTPDSEASFKTYKSMKHSKKNVKKRIKKFEEFVNEKFKIYLPFLELKKLAKALFKLVDEIIPESKCHLRQSFDNGIVYDIFDKNKKTLFEMSYKSPDIEILIYKENIKDILLTSDFIEYLMDIFKSDRSIIRFKLKEVSYFIEKLTKEEYEEYINVKKYNL